MVLVGLIRTLLVVSLVAAPVEGASAQAVVTGRVTDAASDDGVRGALVSLVGRGALLSDSAGRFSFASVQPGTYRLGVHCPVQRRMFGRVIWSGELAVRGDTTLLLSIDQGECAEPPVTVTTGTFRGFYDTGFELSSFRPCTPLPDLSGTGYGLSDPDAWVEFSEAARAGLNLSARDGREVPGGVRFHVVWVGTLRGPGGYGHLGASAYEFVVEDVIEIRRPSPEDCRLRSGSGRTERTAGQRRAIRK